jgi:hypothetical protein
MALLAFVIAFYVLLARERKIPYITHFVFPPAGLFILAVLFSLLGQLFQPSTQASQNPPSGLAKIRAVSGTAAIWLAVLCLAAGILVTLLHIWRLHNRQVHFRDDHWIRNTRLVRWMKRRRRQGNPVPTYEHSPIDVDAKEIVSALTSAGFRDVPQSALELRTISMASLHARLGSLDWRKSPQTQFFPCLKSTNHIRSAPEPEVLQSCCREA